MSAAHVMTVEAPWRVPFLGVQNAVAELLAKHLGPAPQPPVIVRMTRIAPHSRLTADGLAVALAHVGVGVAYWFGVDPLDARLTWISDRESRGRGIYGIRIEIELVRDKIRVPTVERETSW